MHVSLETKKRTPLFCFATLLTVLAILFYNLVCFDRALSLADLCASVVMYFLALKVLCLEYPYTCPFYIVEGWNYSPWKVRKYIAVSHPLMEI